MRNRRRGGLVFSRGGGEGGVGVGRGGGDVVGGEGGGDAVWGEGEGGGDFFFLSLFFFLQVLKGKKVSYIRCYWFSITGLCHIRL